MEILKKKQLKCYLYTRVSTSMQVDGYSLDAQRDKLRKYAAYEDMIVAGEYSDEGFSGKNIQGRQEFQRMLNDIQDGKDDVSYVLVFKLSRFGRNAADVLNSLQLMQDFGVNLICVEDGIDSSKDAGKLMISVLSAVAEIERENIRTQTMAGREQKAREGKWNGGFAPYGYKLENGNLVIAEDEVEVIRVIYDRYIHTNEGVAGVAKYLNRNGYFLRDRKRGYEDAIIEHFVFQVVPILREYVKDGILDATENLVPLEHSPAEIFDAGSGEEQVTLLSENIMLYVKEFGNLTKSNATIDNEYVGKFIDELRKEFSY